MALYRCAACGSPNVMTDTQIGGLKYDYLKGAVGTAILGAGGAAAGIKPTAASIQMPGLRANAYLRNARRSQAAD